MVQKIISGGQTGVDRAALDFALENGIDCGGWCPKGRLAEDGIIPDYYPLKETESDLYEQRTEKNVVDSDGTLILSDGVKLNGGTVYTYSMVLKYNKPALVLNVKEVYEVNLFVLTDWITTHKIKTLNIAGARSSEVKGIYEKTKVFLNKLKLHRLFR